MPEYLDIRVSSSSNMGAQVIFVPLIPYLSPWPLPNIPLAQSSVQFFAYLQLDKINYQLMKCQLMYANSPHMFSLRKM